jgi:hypothetical protein
MSEQKEVHSVTLDVNTGRRSYEGEHRVVIVSRDMPWNAELLVDGKAVRNVKRIEIDIDCEKALQLVKLNSVIFDDEGETQMKNLVTELTANALNVTIEEAVCVELILEKARQEAMSNARAVQLFSITESDDSDEPNMAERILLSDLLRDAKRYHALRLRVEHEQEGVEMYFENPQAVDVYADGLRADQAEARRAQKARQS